MGTSAILHMFVYELPTPRPGGTVDVYFYTKDETGNPLDHTTPVVTINDPSGAAAVSAQAATSLAQGLSVYRFLVAAGATQGTYRAMGTASITLNNVARTEAGEVRFVVRDRKP